MRTRRVLKPLLRYNATLSWLCTYGFSRHTIRELIRTRRIRGISLRAGGRSWYSPSRIWRDLSRDIPLEQIEIAHPDDPQPFRSFRAKQLVVPYGIMRDWLHRWGLPECEVRALIKTKQIRTTSGTRGWRRFSVRQIKRDVLGRVLGESAYRDGGSDSNLKTFQ